MFAGYEGLATYYVDQDEFLTQTNDVESLEVPVHYLLPEPLADPWFSQSSTSDDFLLLAEGSELEGPIPLITIPKNGCGKFNVDDFVVRIMSVDRQIMSNSSSFSICEDVQVILSQTENGIYSYVHYFTLYDSRARGFVRPFCLAYITPDYSKVTNMCNELMSEFTRVSDCFKSGNQIVFFQDMAHTLSDLQFTRERYLECQNSLKSVLCEDTEGQLPVSVSEEFEDEKSLKSLCLEDLDASIVEVKNILQILNATLEKSEQDMQHYFCCNTTVDHQHETPLDAENFRITHTFNSHLTNETKNWCTHNSGNCTGTTCQILTDISESYKPKLKTDLKPVIQKSLRSIHDLCNMRAKQGLDYLNHIYKYFRRDTATLLLEKEDTSILDPSCGLLTIGRTVYLNFLKGFDLFENGGCPMTSPKSCSVICSPAGALVLKWQSFDTLASFFSCESPESYISCSGLTSPSGNNSTIAMHSPSSETEKLVQSLYSLNSTSETKESQSQVSDDYISNNIFHSCGRITTNLNRPQTLSLAQKPSQVPTQVSVTSVLDHVLSLKDASYRIGCGILSFVKEHSFAIHLAYSLLCGRPVVIVGSLSFEKEIRDLVTALWILLPGHSSSSSVLPWTTVPLKLGDLSNLKLCGLGKPDKKPWEFMIPKNIKCYATVLYFNKQLLWGPKYEDGILTEAFQMNEAFECDGTFISFIHNKLFQLALKSYSYFHLFCMRKSAGFRHRLASMKQQEMWMEASRAYCKKLKLTENDLRITEFLVEVVVSQQMSEIQRPDAGESSSALHLDHQPCYHFTCS